MSSANRVALAAAGVLADRALGEPPLQPHPLAVFGRAMQGVERHLYRDSYCAGMAHTLVGVNLGVTTGRLVGSAAVATYLAVAGRALAEAASAVEHALGAGDLQRARTLLPALVRRDPEHLGAEVARAVVESVAENTVDAVDAPALWAAVAGPPGALGYRAVNTLDAMVGHRSARYRRYGWSSARLDDVAGWGTGPGHRRPRRHPAAQRRWLPAPSATITSKRERRSDRASSTRASSRGFSAW